MRKKTKALRLNRETVRLMGQGQLGIVAGGSTLLGSCNTCGTPCSYTACDGYGNSGCPHTCVC
jgi:hypothetical protein